MEQINKASEALEQHAHKIPPLIELSKKTGQRPGKIMLLGAVVVALLILYFMGMSILTVAISVAYPALKSIRALETKDDEEDDKMWLSYWCVFGVFTIVDEFAGFILLLIPFYVYIKLAFFLWMQAPQTQGALVVYNKGLKPLLLKHGDKIEQWISRIKAEANSAASDIQKKAQEEMSKPENISMAANLASQAQQQMPSGTDKKEQ